MSLPTNLLTKVMLNTSKSTQSEAEQVEVKAETLKKRIYRERLKIQKTQEMAAGVHLLAAKKKMSAFIKENPDSNLKFIIEEYKLLLTEAEQIKLKEARKYLMKTSRAHPLSKNLKSDPSQSDSMQMTLSKVTEINLRLCNITESEQLESEVKDLLKNDIWGLIAYVKSNKPTQQNMLGAIVKGCTQEINEQNCELFVQLCKNANIFHLDVSGPLVEAAMRYLNRNLENDAILGLLRFVLSNSLSLTEFDLATVTNFQDRYYTAIESFFNQNPKFRYSNRTPFPPTLFCFTKPLLNQIMSHSDKQMIIFKNFHLIFQTELLHIIGYSFNDNEQDLWRFMELFTKLTMSHNKLLYDTGFLDLLKAMTQHALLKEEGYFRTLRKPTEIFEQILCLATERKLPRFDDNFIDNLLKHEKHFIDTLMNAPRMLEQKSDSTLKNFLVEIQKNNKDIEFDQPYMCSQLSVDDQSLVEAIKLTHLLPSQHMLYKYCLQQHNYTCCHPALNFFQLDTGQGKTALCRLLAFNWAKNRELVIILNNSVELTLRDCFDSGQLAQVSDLKVLQLSKKLLQADLHEQLSYGGIMYATSETFFSLIQDINQDLISSATFIIDEFDSLLFEDVNLANQCVKLFHQISRLYCFSGSLFLKEHINFLKEYCDSPLLNFSLMKSEKIQLKCLKKVAFTNQKDQLKRIKEQCEQLKLCCPTIIVAPEQHKKLAKSLQTKTGASVEDIVNATPESVDSTLKHFLDKHQEMYKIVIVSSQQARGLDFWTNDSVEKCGGVNLIIAELPVLFLHYQQYLGRIGRIGMQGQYSVIIKHNDAPSNNDENWVQQQLDVLEKNEFGRMLQFRIDAQKIKKEMIFVETEEAIENEGMDSEQFVNGSIESEQEESEEFVVGTRTKKGLVQEKPEDKSFRSLLYSNQSIQIGHVVQNNKDLEMLDQQSNSVNDSGKSFDAQQLDSKLVKLQQKQNQKAKEGNSKKKREQKEQDKEDKLLEKQEQNIAQSKKQSASVKIDKKRTGVSKEYEECKFCDELLIEPHVCKKIKNDVQSQLQTILQRDIDIDGQYTLQKVIDFQQKNVSDEDIINLEIKVDMFGALGNNGPLLQKRLKDTRETELVKQTTRKSTRNKKLKVQAEVSKEKTQREVIDEGYFKNYSDSSIHKEMLSDKVRVEMYQKAIELACKGKQVLDLGCGSGVLSALAVKSGAEQVYAVDNADIKDIMTEQLGKMEVDFTKIKYIQGQIESFTTEEIPQVDVIVSEWMGYFLLFENMIGSYIYAKKYLKADGIMIPQQAGLHLHPAAYDTKGNKITKKHLQGKHKVVKVALCKPENLIQEESVVINTLDFTGANLQNPLDQGFSYDFGITVGKQGLFNAFVGSFDVKLYEGVFLNTMPTCQETHWKQSLFFIDNPIQVSEGDTIEGTIKVNVDQENYRNLIVKFTYEVEGKGGSKAEECFTFE